MFGPFEPVLNSATVKALVSAILGALVAFNVGLTPDQQTAILGLVGAICAIIFAVDATWTRSQVSPVVPVEKVEQLAREVAQR